MKDFRQVAKHKILQMKIKNAFPMSSEEEWSECYRNVFQCVEKHSQRVS